MNTMHSLNVESVQVYGHIYVGATLVSFIGNEGTNIHTGKDIEYLSLRNEVE